MYTPLDDDAIVEARASMRFERRFERFRRGRGK
jgi:hypothetical protein